MYLLQVQVLIFIRIPRLLLLLLLLSLLHRALQCTACCW
jgi:hypothetical protein